MTSALASTELLRSATDFAAALSLFFREADGSRRPVPYTLSPATISTDELEAIWRAAPLLGKLTQVLANNNELIAEAHSELNTSDPFFAELLDSHAQLHRGPTGPLRVPLLLQRSDFMIDADLGPRLVECNSIAAGMAPFGEQVSVLHRQLAGHFAELRADYSHGELLANGATGHMARAIRGACKKIAADLDDDGPVRFLMVVQEGEDNVFDQRLLEHALHEQGIQTYRRTLRQLHAELESGPRESLQLAGVGTVHVVYLRAGYQYVDYVAQDLDKQRCCDALQETRLFIERHRVALNATVAQQLATSKRMQLYLSRCDGEVLKSLPFSERDRAVLRSVFTEMQGIDAGTAQRLRREGCEDKWVLKNQGEGGGNCLFGADVVTRIEAMRPEEYSAWTLMRRLHPRGRSQPTIIVRDNKAEQVKNLVSEIGWFTAHLDETPLDAGNDFPGSIGYLVRSKPPHVAEGGIHSGYGALDSLYIGALKED